MKMSAFGALRHGFDRWSRLTVVALIGAAAALPSAALAADPVLLFSNATQIVTTPAKITNTNFTFEAWFKIASFTNENQICAQYSSVDSRRRFPIW